MTRAISMAIALLAVAGCEQEAASPDEASGAGSPSASAGESSSGSSEAGASGAEGGAPMSQGSDEAGAPSQPLAGTGGSSAGANQGGSGGSGGGPLGYLPCESKQDCAEFGGGKICCAVGAMHFCTKQSACPGDPLP